MLDAPVIRRQLVEHYRNELRRIAQLADASSRTEHLEFYAEALRELEQATVRRYPSEAHFIAEMDRIRSQLRSRLTLERTRDCG